MKKILTFLLTLWLFAPDISALDEEVYLGFWIPQGNTSTNIASEAGVYSKKEGESPNKESYGVTVRYGLQQNSTNLNWANFPWNSSVQTIGTIQQFAVENKNIIGFGFNVEFNGELRSNDGYALRLQLPVNSNSYGAYNGLCLRTPQYPYYTTITISSTAESRPIKKVKFGKTRPQLTNEPYSVSSFDGTEDMSKFFTRVNEAGKWEFDATDNCWAYVFDSSVESVDFRTAEMSTAASALYLNKLGIVWDAPIEPPTINKDAAPTDGDLTLTGVNTYSYNYYNTPAVLKCFTMPAGCEKMVFATADIPTENWRDYDPATGVELPANAVWNQETLVQIAGVDKDGNVGLPLIINCKRLEPKAPNRPQVIRYAKSFLYNDVGSNTTLRFRSYPQSQWISVIDQNQNNLSIEVDGDALVLDLQDAYATALDEIGGSANTDIVPVGGLEYAVTDGVTPPDESFEVNQRWKEAVVNPGTTAPTYINEKDLNNYFGPQYGWFVFGRDVKGNGGPNVGTFNLSGENAVQYLHLRAYTEVGEGKDAEKFYSPVTTIAITRTPLAGPELSMPEDENYTWVGGAIAKMTYAKTASLYLTLPEDTPAGVMNIEYAYEGADGELGLEPVSSIQYLREWVDGAEKIFVYDPKKPCVITLGGNNGIGQNGGTPYAGRLFVRSRDSKTYQRSAWTIVDVTPIVTQDYYMDGYAAPAQGYSQNDLVTLYGGNGDNHKMRIVDVFATDAALENGKTTYYVYLENHQNDAIKLVINSATKPAVLDTYKTGSVINGGDIIGRVAYRNFVGGIGTMPEILITPTKDEDFINYLPKAITDEKFSSEVAARNCPDVKAVTDVDFNKKVRVRGLEKIAGSSKMRGTDGTEYTIYTRLHYANEDAVEDALANMEDGNVYAITCFVGQTVGSLALLPCDFPLECPDTPEIFAPNPITDGELDAISPELTITIGNTVQRHMTYYWSDVLNIDKDAPVDIAPELSKLNEIKLVDGVPTFILKKENYKVAGDGKRGVTLSVYARNEDADLWSIEPAIIEIEWHELDKNHGTVSSIAEFKALYLEDKNLPESISERLVRDKFNATHYHQFSNKSEAVVIEATEEWLYIRDRYPTRDDKKFHSENYILMHNDNKWVNPPVPVAGEEDSVRMLRQGDIINNFALIPALSRRGNLISESTGFARTVHYIDSIPKFELALRPIEVGYADETWMPDPENDDYSGYYANIELGENQRMRYLDIRNVKIEKIGQDYFLVLGKENNIALAFDIFEECYNGWDNFYNPDDPDELYNIKGVFLKNEKDRDESYAIAMIDFSTNKGQVEAPKLYATESTNKEAELQYFINNLDVNIEHEEGSSVFYSINGVDPKNMTPDADGNYPNRLSYDGESFRLELPTNSDRITVKAYAYRPGYKPSATVSRIFVRNSTELQYIFQFLDQARQGRYYRLTSNLKVIATGGKYMFLAGPMGYFLPVINEDGWDNTELAAGRYVKNFTVGYMRDSHDNRIAVATGHMSTFDNVTSPLWEGDKKTPEADEFHAQPDTLTSISVNNARRLVTLMNVAVTDGLVQTTEGDDLWYIQDGETGQNIPMYVGRLGKVNAGSYNADGTRVSEDLIDGAAYNITGFVMLGDPTSREGEVEFWPLMADRVTRSPRATAEFTNVIGSVQQTTPADYMVNFNGTTTVTLKSPRPNTTISYMVESLNSNSTWYTYQHPIVVDKSDVIRVRCQEPAFAASEVVVITLNKVDRAGDVNFNVTSEYGRTTVRLTTDEPNATIYYGINDPSCSSRYSSRLQFTQGAKLYACVQVSGKPRGAVSMLQVMVVGGETSSVSGNVKFELEENEGATKVKISPVDNLASGSYSIYYTLDSGVPFAEDAWIKYDGSFEMKESGLIMAVLVENDKPRGQISETFVWVYVDPAGVDDIDSDRAEETVTVSGNDIVAPEGSMVFDLMGRRVNAEGLRAGIYIVRTPAGKAVKVQIR